MSELTTELTVEDELFLAHARITLDQPTSPGRRQGDVTAVPEFEGLTAAGCVPLGAEGTWIVPPGDGGNTHRLLPGRDPDDVTSTDITWRVHSMPTAWPDQWVVTIPPWQAARLVQEGPTAHHGDAVLRAGTWRIARRKNSAD